jgi:hypothetical protein
MGAFRLARTAQSSFEIPSKDGRQLVKDLDVLFDGTIIRGKRSGSIRSVTRDGVISATYHPGGFYARLTVADPGSHTVEWFSARILAEKSRALYELPGTTNAQPLGRLAVTSTNRWLATRLMNRRQVDPKSLPGISVTPPEAARLEQDYDGDHRSIIAVHRPGAGLGELFAALGEAVGKLEPEAYGPTGPADELASQLGLHDAGFTRVWDRAMEREHPLDAATACLIGGFSVYGVYGKAAILNTR